MKKAILYTFLAILSGLTLGKLTFDRYEKFDVDNVIKLDSSVYVLKYGVFNSKSDMENNVIDVSRYIYVQKDNKYYVYVAISKSLDSINKLKNIYSNDFEVEKVNISNDEFIMHLDEYEKLLVSTNDKEALVVIENEILSCYEKLVVNNE